MMGNSYPGLHSVPALNAQFTMKGSQKLNEKKCVQTVGLTIISDFSVSMKSVAGFVKRLVTLLAQINALTMLLVKKTLLLSVEKMTFFQIFIRQN